MLMEYCKNIINITYSGFQWISFESLFIVIMNHQQIQWKNEWMNAAFSIFTEFKGCYN